MSIVERSVKRLEDEIAELEAQELARMQGGQDEEEDEGGSKPDSGLVKPPVKSDKEPLKDEEETFKKRYSDLRRYSQKQIDELKAQINELQKSKNGVDLPTAEEAETWAKANPKAAAIIRALAGKEVATTAPQLEEINTLRKDLDRTKQEAKIKKSHPDFEEIVADDAFHDWAENQPERVQNFIYEGDAEDVIWAIDLYKKFADTKNANPSRDAARNVNKSKPSKPEDDAGKGRFTESQVRAMTLAEYEKNEEAITQSQRDGTFVYDLTAGAR